MSRFRIGSSAKLSAYEDDEDAFSFSRDSHSSLASQRRRRPKSSTGVPAGSIHSPQPSVASSKAPSSLVSTIRQEWRSSHKEIWKRRDHNARHIAGRKQRPQTAPMGRGSQSSTRRGKPTAYTKKKQFQYSPSSSSQCGFRTPKALSPTKGKTKRLRPRTAGSALLAKQSVQRIKRSRPRPKTAAQSKSCFRFPLLFQGFS